MLSFMKCKFCFSRMYRSVMLRLYSVVFIFRVFMKVIIFDESFIATGPLFSLELFLYLASYDP